jgi:hypothetical protein
VIAIHEHSRGIPRIMGVSCDNALVSGFATDVKPVGRDLILEVCRDFALDQPPSSAPRAASHPPADRARPGPEAHDRTTDQKAEAEPMFSGLNRPRRFSFF